MSIQVTINGQSVDFEAAANLMDDGIRERLHDDFERRVGKGSPVTAEEAQVFADEYCARHEAVYGAAFTL